MFCFQCQETINNKGCSAKMGACGKLNEVAVAQDDLILTLKKLGQAACSQQQQNKDVPLTIGYFMAEALFATITNANFNLQAINNYHAKAQQLIAQFGGNNDNHLAGVLATGDEDIRSWRELMTYGLKGTAAYLHHAAVLGYEEAELYSAFYENLANLLNDTLTINDLTAATLAVGRLAGKAMALLDKANTTSYGQPQPTQVNIGVGTRPAILVSGHDLKDLEQLLSQTENEGLDIYTHSEMLPAHYYPKLSRYKHLVGNYGNAWFKQHEEFNQFNGPVLFTSNCLVPAAVKGNEAKIFTTGAVGYPGCTHITADSRGEKDFSALIALAKTLPPPTQIESGYIIGGFAHNQVIAVADKLVAAIKEGAIKKFVVMSGCDGRHNSRAYYTDFAADLPKDVIILTSGCAKYRYNKLNLGDINGIPRVLDAGQCNDSYSWLVVALKLQEVFKVNNINDLPIVFNIAWYEQKAVAVLLALLANGITNIHLGPTLPAFVSPNVLKLLGDNFKIGTISTAANDVSTMLS
ncbi:MAG: hydroxylamine reductase [Spirochaetaceae bacterium]|nr:hydroxylamine reductase [Spirochaetaceae bacterium]